MLLNLLKKRTQILIAFLLSVGLFVAAALLLTRPTGPISASVRYLPADGSNQSAVVTITNQSKLSLNIGIQPLEVRVPDGSWRPIGPKPQWGGDQTEIGLGVTGSLRARFDFGTNRPAWRVSVPWIAFPRWRWQYRLEELLMKAHLSLPRKRGVFVGKEMVWGDETNRTSASLR